MTHQRTISLKSNYNCSPVLKICACILQCLYTVEQEALTEFKPLPKIVTFYSLLSTGVAIINPRKLHQNLFTTF